MNENSFVFLQKGVSLLTLQYGCINIMYCNFCLVKEKDEVVFEGLVDKTKPYIIELRTNIRNLLNVSVTMNKNVENKLSFLDLECKRQGLHNRASDWDEILHMTNANEGFKPVFKYLLELLDEIDQILSDLSDSYEKLDAEGKVTDEVGQTLLILDTKISKFSSYIKILSLMFIFLNTSQTETITTERRLRLVSTNTTK